MVGFLMFLLGLFLFVESAAIAFAFAALLLAKAIEWAGWLLYAWLYLAGRIGIPHRSGRG